jgi:hypothetical protein
MECVRPGIAMASHRSSFSFIFSTTFAAVFLISTGLIGYQPPAHLSLDAGTWRRGVWTGHVIISQLSLGVVLLAAAATAAVRLNRRLGGELRKRPIPRPSDLDGRQRSL